MRFVLIKQPASINESPALNKHMARKLSNSTVHMHRIHTHSSQVITHRCRDSNPHPTKTASRHRNLRIRSYLKRTSTSIQFSWCHDREFRFFEACQIAHFSKNFPFLGSDWRIGMQHPQVTILAKSLLLLQPIHNGGRLRRTQRHPVKICPHVGLHRILPDRLFEALINQTQKCTQHSVPLRNISIFLLMRNRISIFLLRRNRISITNRECREGDRRNIIEHEAPILISAR